MRHVDTKRNATLTFKKNLHVIYLNRPARATHGNVKVKVDIMSRTTTEYLYSPFLLGTVLWDGLPVEIQKKKEKKRKIENPFHQGSHFSD